jgi:hypothetical protein
MCASFCAGTRILTTRGRVRVEKLRLGDEAITALDGPLPIQWIGQRIYGRHFARLNPNSVPIKIMADALDDGIPSRDICISPSHNIYVDGTLIPAGLLVNGSSVVLCEEMDPIAYYHIELPIHSVVLAEDLPTESYVDRGDRAMFMNSLHSDHGGDGKDARAWASCAPVVQSGPGVDRLRARLALRAGIVPSDIMERPQTGPLLGRLEFADWSVISGWAWLPDHPDVAVVLEVMNQGEIVAVSIADLYRADLRRAGIGDGRHAFHVDLPRPLDPNREHRLVIRRAADGLALPGCPRELPRRLTSDSLAGINLASMVENADPAETRRVLAWLEEQAVQLHARLSAPPEPRAAMAGTALSLTMATDRRPHRIKLAKAVPM